MKLLKILLGFSIFYFGFILVGHMFTIAKTISMGNIYIEYGFYCLMVVLFVVYIVYPILRYMAKPSTKVYIKVFDGDDKATKKIKKYFVKHVEGEDLESLLTTTDNKAFRTWLYKYLDNEVNGFSKIISSYAFKLSSAVLLSPNSFLDGITILYGNSNMIYTLSKRVHVRYNAKELWEMYFSVMSVASISGLIEEFDDLMVEVFEELLEELSEKMGEEAGTAITDAIPLISIATKATSFLLQSAGNFAYVVYNGNRFKHMIQNLYAEERLSQQEINKVARKEARKSRLQYVSDLSKGIAGKVNLKNHFKGKGFWKKSNKEETEGSNESN